MTSRVLALLVAISVTARIADAAPELPAAAGEDEQMYSCKERSGPVAITFKPETEVKDLLTWVMGFTCKNFVLDPRIVLTGRKVTVVAPAKMSAKDAYRMFLVSLSTIGLTVVPKGNVMTVVDAGTARHGTVPIVGKSGLDATDQMVRYVYRPSYAQPETLMQAFTALKSDAGDVQLVGAILLLTDYGSHVHDMMSLAHLIDVPGGSDGIYTIAVQHADATKLAEKLGTILGLPVGGSAAATPALKPSATPAAAVPSKLIVDERTNTLVVAGTEAGYLRVKALVERLDISLDIEGGTAIHVYRLGSAIAEELAKTLNDAISGQAGKAPTTVARPAAPAVSDALGTALEGQVRVIADAPTNALIVMSSGRDFVAIKDVIKQLDQPRRQVYIEALILEIGVSDGLDAGVSAHGGMPDDSGGIAVAGVQMPALSSLNPATLSGASGLLGGLVGKALEGSESVLGLGASIPSYGVLFQAVANHTNTNVLSAPSIIALDNAEAKYKVGTNIPYKKGESVGGVGSLEGSVSTQIDRKDLLLELDIKPHISIDDSVLLEIKHDAADLADTTSALGPSWSTRSFETRVLVRDQQTVVIGGLMQERETNITTKVPIVGDIPLLGYLFRYTTKTKRKTNLVIMLTPYIIKDQLDLELIRQRKAREQDEFSRSFGTLHAMAYKPGIDYRRKRGLLEEINRVVQGVEEDRATRAALHAPAPVNQGVIEYAP